MVEQCEFQRCINNLLNWCEFCCVQMYRWLLFAATELGQPLWRIARHASLYPEASRLPADIPLARRDFTNMAAVLESHMSGRQFVVGEQVTIADFVLAYTLD